MKKINKYLKILVLGTVAVLLHSCETTELDISQNPNFLTPSQASADFFLNSIQEDFIRQFEGQADGDTQDNFPGGGADGFHNFGMELTRMSNLNGRDYTSAYQASTFDDEWSNCYEGILIDIRNMNPIAEEAGQTRHIGIGQFIEAFLMTSMVDFFGDVPYSEAINDGTNFNPSVDPGAGIYDAALALLDQAIANFNSSPSSDPVTDFFYGNDYDKWVKAANSVKIRLYLQRRLVDSNAISSINAIVTSGDYIQDTADDFQFLWSASSNTQPDTRHPMFGRNYTVSGANDYMSNWLMNLMDTNADPRIRYYYYRQTDVVPGNGSAPNEETLNCSLEDPPQHYIDGGFTYCNLPNGYWGRDHGDDDGVPPDGFLRTTFGVYPAGGKFDDDSFSGISTTSGSGGRGVTLLLTANSIDFTKAEIAMINNDLGAAKASILDGFDKSMAKVQAFASGRTGGADLSFEPSAGDVSTYRNTLGIAFDAADLDGKWNILAEQYWIASYGEGVGPYNFYRRTGYPTTLQTNVEPAPGVFIRSMYYPTNSVNNNSSISQKPDQTQPVFWDTNASAPASN